MRKGILHVKEYFEETHCNVLHHITLQAESTFTFQPNSYLKTPGVHSQKNYFHAWWFLYFHGIKNLAMPSWFMVPLESWLSCTLYQQILLPNLRHFEIYRQHIEAACTRSVSLESSFLATLVALHSTPVSEPVSGQSFGLQPSSVAWSLRACWEFIEWKTDGRGNILIYH